MVGVSFQALLGVSGAVVPIGTPASLGTNSTTASSSTVALTAIANILAGDTVIVNVANNNALTVSSVSDGTNTYSLVARSADNTGNSNRIDQYYAANCAAVTSPTITATMSASGTSNRSICAARVTGLIAAPIDKQLSGISAGGTPSIASGTLAQANEILFGGATANAAVTGSSGYTVLIASFASGAMTLNMEYKIVAVTTTSNYAPTTGGSSAGAVLGSFKGN